MQPTAFTRLFDLQYPLMQTPMGGVSTPELVAAVSNAGGMGMLAAAGLPPAGIRAQIMRVRALTPKAFGVNLLLPLIQPGQVEACLAERVPLLSLFWGDAAPYVAAAHAAGVKVMLQVGSAAEAGAARAAGVDLVAAQGVEAGGHVRGTVSTFVLVPAVIDAVRPLPVLAAGGIADGRGLAAALALGAAGAALGTRFLASVEAGAHPDYKRRLLAAGGADTFHSCLFDVGWPAAPHRVLRNSVVEAWEAAGCPPSGQRPGENELIGTVRYGELSFPVPRYASFPASAGFAGDVEQAALYAGQSCELVHALQPAAEIVAEVVREADAILHALAV
jgi:nitronate monooxygenase